MNAGLEFIYLQMAYRRLGHETWYNAGLVFVSRFLPALDGFGSLKSPAAFSFFGILVQKGYLGDRIIVRL